MRTRSPAQRHLPTPSGGGERRRCTVRIAVILVGCLLALKLIKLKPEDHKHPHPPPPPCPPPCPPSYQIPDTFNEQTLPAALNARLIGSPANGVPVAAMPAVPAQVVWVNGGNEVLVHLDSTQARILNGLLLVSVDLETDQTGRTPLVCAYALGTTGDQAGLVATTDEFPRGNGGLAATWGKQLQQAIWSSILSLSIDHATERKQAARGIFAAAGTLSLSAGDSLALSANTKGQA